MHLSRKLFHATGIVIVAIYRGFDLTRPWAAGILLACVALLVLLDVLRSRVPALQALFLRSFRVLLAEKDLRGASGATYYFAGCALTIALLPPEAASAGVLALAMGDPYAAIMGTAIRSPRWGRVSLAGCVACYCGAMLGVRLFFDWPVALIAAGVATLLEAFSGAKADNLTIPLGTALCCHLLG